VNFNRAPDRRTPYRGAGIFVHVRDGATAGCVATSSANVVTMLRTMRSGDTITIAA
jgi:L,D-peptidoglycan transpeptidase YkuD (ErfK/YbiS/YcfS/YnhG family)